MGMTREIKRYLKKNLDENRYQHTMNVRKTARKLARRHLHFESRKQRRAYLKKVSLAALLHDIDKGQSSEVLWRRLKKAPEVAQDDLKSSREIWHAFTAALTARDVFGMADEDVLNAVRYHTTGRSGMSALEKIIYLADCIEPNRHYDGVEEIRRAAREGLDLGILVALDSSIRHLQDKGANIFASTLEARKDIAEHGIFTS